MGASGGWELPEAAQRKHGLNGAWRDGQELGKRALTPAGGSRQATQRMRVTRCADSPALKTHCPVKRGRKGVYVQRRGRRNTSGVEGVKGDAYFTVYFLTLLKTHAKNINGEIQVKSWFQLVIMSVI